jgi:hypothetical protein
VTDEKKSVSLAKDEEERNLVSSMITRFNKAETAYESKRKVWNMLDKFDRGEQWVDQVLPPWVPTPVTNYIRYVRTLKRANLASAIPEAHYTATDEKYKADMDMLQKAYKYVWQTEKVQRTIRRCIDRTIIQGTSVAVVYSDESYVGGNYHGKGNPNNSLFRGRICVRRYPIGNFFPDPDGYRIDDCKYVELTENLTLKEIKANKKFKEHAGKALSDLNIDMLESTDSANGQIFDRENGPGRGTQSVLGDEMVTVHIHWEQYFNEKGARQVDVTYYIPQVQLILYRAEDVKPSTYPFALLYDEEEENDIFGTSTAMDIFNNQKIINRTSQTASVMGVLNQNSQKVVSKQSGINAQEMARTGTMPGKVWVTNDRPSESVHILKPDDIPKGLFELEDRLKNDIKDMVGINEAYTGQSVGSLTTSTGVNALIERATIRDKDKMIQIDEFVERISDLIIMNIMYKWKEKRPITTFNRNNTAVFQTYEPLNDDAIKNMQWICKSDIYAVAPTTQAIRKQQADDLMQKQGQFNYDPPIITPEEWLRFQDFDMKDEIIARMKMDRERMEKEKALKSAQIIVQTAEVIRQNIAKGMPVQQAQQIAQEAAQKLLDAQSQADRTGTRPRDAAAPAQGPKGTTGQMAMHAMAKGS